MATSFLTTKRVKAELDPFRIHWLPTVGIRTQLRVNKNMDHRHLAFSAKFQALRSEIIKTTAMKSNCHQIENWMLMGKINLLPG